MNHNTAVTLLAALAQESRLAIFRLLVQHATTGLAVGKISELLGGMAGATLSFHLKELNHAGLIEAKSEGRHIIYSANLDNMQQLLTFLTDDCCGGQPCNLSQTTSICC
ncbi:MAG: helix-turn-helix transcriptional regulator [Moraxellaceae bacterium]|jgi:ArsR family transcriptional regulator|nr:helix-turn-helix transcriptional regulator [Moraxellaceae bacterium]